MSFNRILSSAAVTFLLFSSMAIAQQQKVEPRRAGEPARNQAGQQSNWQSNDHLLASCVAIDNQEEVALARFAEKQSKNENVKKFAKMMIDDHSAFLKKLQTYAPEATKDNYLSETPQTAQNTEAQSQPLSQSNKNTKSKVIERIAAKPPINDGSSAQSGQPIDMGQLHRELAAQCLADTKAMLQDKNQDAFDECFIGLQIAKHAAMKTKLKVLQRHTSDELAQLFHQASETTGKHLEHAEKLMKELAEDSGSGKSNSRSDSTKKSDSKE